MPIQIQATGWRISILSIALLILAACSLPHEYTGLLFDSPQPAAEIVGVDQEGDPFRLSDHRGKVNLIFFGYTYCPDICPMTLSQIARAYEQLIESDPSLAQQINIHFISFDPERDSPERLAAYVPAFHPDFTGVYLEPAKLEAIKKPYGLLAEKSSGATSDGGYTMDHTSGIYLIDREGNWTGLFKADISADALAADLRAFLNR